MSATLPICRNPNDVRSIPPNAEARPSPSTNAAQTAARVVYTGAFEAHAGR